MATEQNNAPLVTAAPLDAPELDGDEIWARLQSTLGPATRWLVITGAGVSAASGIPTYRDDSGTWLRSDPIQHQDFVQSASTRRRYWARSMVGWPLVVRARPNAAHHALSRLETLGRVPLLVTQNVDRLHQSAGQQRVIDLHGRLDRVRCLSCRRMALRSEMQRRLETLNSAFTAHIAEMRPDGDADVDAAQLQGFTVPSCTACGGVIMPDVVFFGGSVRRSRVAHINRVMARCDAVVVAGSSMRVFSGFRFCRLAQQLGKPLIIINRGVTRADELATLKVARDCATVFRFLASRIL
jgi:NAD-dependent SIR2 family protein deacetylase